VLSKLLPTTLVYLGPWQLGYSGRCPEADTDKEKARG
jgi:hypothetical protein